MTILRSIPASFAATEEAQPPGILPVESAPVATEATRTAWLLSWILARAGFLVHVTIGDAPGASATTQPPYYALHLAEAIQVQSLVRVLQQFRSSDPRKPLLITREEPSRRGRPYQERLELDGAQDVVSIRRGFSRHRAERRERLVGVAMTREAAGASLDFAGKPWRTARRLMRAGGIRRVVATDAAFVEADPRTALLAHLTPHAMKDLARDLGYRAVRDYCFAHPRAAIDDAAILRPPLFMDAEARIEADHVHVGPAWLSAGCGTTTFPAEPLDSERAYFIAPRLKQRPVYDAAKRAFDVLFSLFILLITLPICLGAALCIKLYDRGPVFFAHRREGVGGRPFGCLKFRTMVRDAEALKKALRAANQVDGPQFKIAHDPRITPIGRFLRKTNIDELPQFLNVLAGQMSVVGPRPSPFDENQLCPGWREARLSVKPGITGLWQVSRSRERGAADFQEWIYFDTQYVERRTFWLDMRIVLLTIKEMFGKGQ